MRYGLGLALAYTERARHVSCPLHCAHDAAALHTTKFLCPATRRQHESVRCSTALVVGGLPVLEVRHVGLAPPVGELVALAPLGRDPPEVAARVLSLCVVAHGERVQLVAVAGCSRGSLTG